MMTKVSSDKFPEISISVQKPVKPVPPVAPVPPEEFIFIEKEIESGNRGGKLIDFLPKDVKMEDVYVMESYCCDCYGSSLSHLHLYTRTKIENPDLKRERKAYEKKIEKYEKDKISYEKKLEKYEEDMKRYNEALKEVRKLRASLKKQG